MENRILERDEWKTALEDLWRKMEGREIRIEVEALNIGDQIEAEHVELRGLSYDPRDDVVQVWVGPLDHMIHHPQRIMLAVERGRLVAIDITDADGEQHIIRPLEAIEV